MPVVHRYAVGVLDKRQGVMRYAEVGAGAVVRMEPRARGVNYGPSGAVTGVEDTAQARLDQNRRSALAPMHPPFLPLKPSITVS